MAGLTKTKKESRASNLLTDPTLFPIYQSNTSAGPYINTGFVAQRTAIDSTFFGAQPFMGSYATQSSGNYTTVLNYTNLTYPIIIGNVVTSYYNGNATYKIKFTVDGVETIIEPTTAFHGRLIWGAQNVESKGMSASQYNSYGYGMRFIHPYAGEYGAYQGSSGKSVSSARQVLEHPMDMYVHGFPVLLAEKSITIQTYCSNLYANTYYNYSFVNWANLKGF
tara:strand:- start:390 stop:1055 length:666 start_codon:yes stop_codon:yes gene_type:complete